MVKPSRRSRTFRRMHVRVPSGESRIIYKRRKPGVPQCAKCRNKLQSVPVTRKMHNLALSHRRPSRPYGGHLCSKCTREEFKLRARGESHA